MLEMIAFHRDEPLGGIVDELVHAGIDIPAREAPEMRLLAQPVRQPAFTIHGVNR